MSQNEINEPVIVLQNPKPAWMMKEEKRDELRAQFLKIMKAVVWRLGSTGGFTWRLDYKPNDFHGSLYLINEQYGARIWAKLIVEGGMRGKIHFSGDSGAYAGFNNYPYTICSEINISMNKNPQQIAGEINRRFIPGFVQYNSELRQKKADTEERNAKQYDISMSLTRASGYALKPTCDGNHQAVKGKLEYTTFNPYRSVKAEIFGDDVQLDMRVSAEMAELILKFYFDNK